MRQTLVGVVAQLVEHHNGIVGPDRWMRMVCPETGRICVFQAQAKHAPASPLSFCVQAFLAERTKSSYRPDYVKSLRQYLTRFCGYFGASMAISSIGDAELARWFAHRNEAPSTRKSNAGRLSAFFAFCVRRRWILANPANFLEPIRLEARTPEILDASACTSLMRFVRWNLPAAVPYFALALFAGIRPDEVCRLAWDDLSLDRAICTVDAAASKVRARRIVPLSENAVAWLRLGGRLPIAKSTRKRCIASARKHLGLSAWPKDVLRHTCASMWLAREEDVGKVARWLGNSPGILLRHYAELVSKGEAEKFWSIRP